MKRTHEQTDETEHTLVEDIWNRITKYLAPETAMIFAFTCKNQYTRIKLLIQQCGLKFMYLKRCNNCGSEDWLHRCLRREKTIPLKCSTGLPVTKVNGLSFVVKCEKVKSIKFCDGKVRLTLSRLIIPSWGCGYTGEMDEFYYYWINGMTRYGIWLDDLKFVWTSQMTGLTTCERASGIRFFRLMWEDDPITCKDMAALVKAKQEHLLPFGWVLPEYLNQVN